MRESCLGGKWSWFVYGLRFLLAIFFSQGFMLLSLYRISHVGELIRNYFRRLFYLKLPDVTQSYALSSMLKIHYYVD